jgi:hypothetical protein
MTVRHSFVTLFRRCRCHGLMVPIASRVSILCLAMSFVAVSSACGGSSQPVPPPVYPVAGSQAEEAGPAVPPVYLHVRAPEGTMLQRLSAGDWDWKDVCWAPCDGYVPAYGSYRLTVRMLPPSAEYTLPGGPATTAQFTLPGPPGTSVSLAVDENGQVWTTSSVQLEARRRAAAVVLLPGPLFLPR